MNYDKIFKASIIVLSLAISVAIILNRDKIAGLEQYGFVGIFLISVIGNATIVVPAPVVLTAFVGGGIFNPIAVGIVTALGATIGELTGYLAGYGGKTFIENNKSYEKIDKWVKTHGFSTIFVLALIPNPLFDFAGICAGATKYPISGFLFATALGKIIKFVVIALIGAYIL